jgi:hypothetical protein
VDRERTPRRVHRPPQIVPGKFGVGLLTNGRRASASAAKCHLSKGEVTARFQNGWLQKKPRKSGDIWVFCYRRQRPEDGEWVQATPIKVGKIKDYPSEEAAWRRVDELHLNPNQSPFEVGAKPLFGDLRPTTYRRNYPRIRRRPRSKRPIRRSANTNAISVAGPCLVGEPFQLWQSIRLM